MQFVIAYIYHERHILLLIFFINSEVHSFCTFTYAKILFLIYCLVQ